MPKVRLSLRDEEQEEFDDDLWIRNTPTVKPQAKMPRDVAAKLSSNSHIMNDIVRSGALYDETDKSNNSSSIAGALLRMRRKRLERTASRHSQHLPVPKNPAASPTGQTSAQSKAAEEDDDALTSPWHRPAQLEHASFSCMADTDFSSSSDDDSEVEVISFDFDHTDINRKNMLVLPVNNTAQKRQMKHQGESAIAIDGHREGRDRKTDATSCSPPIEPLAWKDSPANKAFCRGRPHSIRPVDVHRDEKICNVDAPGYKSQKSHLSKPEHKYAQDERDPSTFGSIPFTGALHRAVVGQQKGALRMARYSSSSSISREDCLKAVRGEAYHPLTVARQSEVAKSRARISAPSIEPSLCNDDYILFTSQHAKRTAVAKPRWFSRWPRFRVRKTLM